MIIQMWSRSYPSSLSSSLSRPAPSLPRSSPCCPALPRPTTRPPPNLNLLKGGVWGRQADSRRSVTEILSPRRRRQTVTDGRRADVFSSACSHVLCFLHMWTPSPPFPLFPFSFCSLPSFVFSSACSYVFFLRIRTPSLPFPLLSSSFSFFPSSFLRSSVV